MQLDSLQRLKQNSEGERSKRGADSEERDFEERAPISINQSFNGDTTTADEIAGL
jgi:hypothetical protein